MSNINTILLLISILSLVVFHELQICVANPKQPVIVHPNRPVAQPKQPVVLPKKSDAHPKQPGASAHPKQLGALPAQPNKDGFMGAQIDCKGKCEVRCKLAVKYRKCFRTCSTCCQRCNCVPPGTTGNTKVCPCWDNLTTKSSKVKCP